MKVLSWNVNKAGPSRTQLWEIFRREDPDIALLQELRELPPWVEDRYACHLVAPRYFGGHRAPFSTAILSKWPVDASPFLSSELDWVNAIHRERHGWIMECQVTREAGERFHVVSVHSPAFPIPRESLTGVDVSAIKLKNNPDVWFTEVLWSLLAHADLGDGTNWIVAGDFNSSLLLDVPRDRGNGQVVERMNGLGFVDGLSRHNGRPVPTFQHSRGSVDHQLDYCYVNRPMLEHLVRATVLSQGEVFDPTPRLSDHLPVLCEFA